MNPEFFTGLFPHMGHLVALYKYVKKESGWTNAEKVLSELRSYFPMFKPDDFYIIRNKTVE